VAVAKLLLVFIALVSILAVSGCALQATTSAPKIQTIDINYNSIVYQDPWIGDLLLPSSGTELAIANVTIVNHGYDSFDVNKNYFAAVVNGVNYRYDSSCYALNILPDVRLANGDTTTGNITFTLPQPSYQFSMQYTGPGKYNINWIELTN